MQQKKIRFGVLKLGSGISMIQNLPYCNTSKRQNAWFSLSSFYELFCKSFGLWTDHISRILQIFVIELVSSFSYCCIVRQNEEHINNNDFTLTIQKPAKNYKIWVRKKGYAKALNNIKRTSKFCNLIEAENVLANFVKKWAIDLHEGEEQYFSGSVSEFPPPPALNHKPSKISLLLSDPTLEVRNTIPRMQKKLKTKLPMLWRPYGGKERITQYRIFQQAKLIIFQELGCSSIKVFKYIQVK